MTNAATRAQDIRDLKGQISELSGYADEQEVIFKETSPRRHKATIYSMVDGEEIEIPFFLLERTIEKKLPNGRFMFTAHKEEAPAYKLGEVKCFLHEEAPEREMVMQIGLGSLSCSASHLANAHSKRIHAQHRHKNEWAALQEYITEQRYQSDKQERSDQTKAILSLAGSAAERGRSAKES